MAFTYDVSTNVGKVRLLIGDTDETDILLQDEDIQFFLDSYGNLKIAASQAAMAISAKFSREADKQVGMLRISFSIRANNYNKLSKELKLNASSILISYVGGISQSDKIYNDDNPDKVSPSFRRNGMNIKNSGEYSG